MAREIPVNKPLELIKRGFSLARAFVRNKFLHVPMGVNFDITYRCNLHCEHCYFAASLDPIKADAKARELESMELSDSQWGEIFKYYRDRGTSSIALTGGEPTLRMPVIREAAKYFSSLQVATNGIIPIPRDIHSAIWVSIDGKKDTHNKIRGANIYDRVMANIQDDARVSISCTLSTTNFLEAHDVVENCLRANIKGVFFMLYSGTKESPLFLRGKRLARVIRSLRELISEYPGFVLLSEPMLYSYATKNFVDSCCFLPKDALIQSFFPNLQRKRCVMGDQVDCQTCSCIVPVGSYCLRAIPPDWHTITRVTRILQQY